MPHLVKVEGTLQLFASSGTQEHVHLPGLLFALDKLPVGLCPAELRFAVWPATTWKVPFSEEPGTLVEGWLGGAWQACPTR